MVATAISTTLTRASETRGSWRALVGICMLLSPILGYAEHVLDPRVGLARAQFAAALAAHPDERLFDLFVGLLGGLVFVPVALGLAHLLRSSAPRAGLIGGCLAITGQLAQMALYGVDLTYLQMARQGFDPVTIAGLMDGFGGSIAGSILLLTTVIGLVVGTLLLAISLLRTRSVPVAAAALIIAFVIADTVAVGANSMAIYLIAHSFLLAGSGWTALGVLTMSNEQWNQCVPASEFGLHVP